MINSLREDFNILGSATIAEGTNGLPKVVLTHRSGSSAEVYLHGGQVTSWKTSGKERLFLSRESVFALGKPIRGGIPVCWPQFGGRGPLPQHGFARTSEWQLMRTELMDNGIVAAELQLTQTAETLALWPHEFALGLRMLLDADVLTVSAQVINTGTQPFDFQLALHTYFQVADIRRVGIHGLNGIKFLDAMKDRAMAVEARDVIRFDRETDRIYVNAPDSLSLNGITIETRNLPDVVVWNPWTDKSRSMADFGDDEYQRMVCVETGSIETRPFLPPGERWMSDCRLKKGKEGVSMVHG
jgi:glucose-6-phosphate 1-epimerase